MESISSIMDTFETEGSALSKHAMFPNGANAEFVEVANNMSVAAVHYLVYTSEISVLHVLLLFDLMDIDDTQVLSLPILVR